MTPVLHTIELTLIFLAGMVCQIWIGRRLIRRVDWDLMRGGHGRDVVGLSGEDVKLAGGFLEVIRMVTGSMVRARERRHRGKPGGYYRASLAC